MNEQNKMFSVEFCKVSSLKCLPAALMAAVHTFDQSTIGKRKYTAASTRKRNVRGQGSLLERGWTSPLRGKLAKARSCGLCVAQGKLRSYRFCNLNAREARVSIDQSARPRN